MRSYEPEVCIEKNDKILLLIFVMYVCMRIEIFLLFIINTFFFGNFVSFFFWPINKRRKKNDNKTQFNE
jgi:hypothetical protein